jgi:hypothetical protein
MAKPDNTVGLVFSIRGEQACKQPKECFGSEQHCHCSIACFVRHFLQKTTAEKMNKAKQCQASDFERSTRG